MRKFVKITLEKGTLLEAIEMPEGEDLNEWYAVNLYEFFNEINLLYGTLAEYCTESSCPYMTAGPKYEYYWADMDRFIEPTRMPAYKYVGLLMSWIERLINTESVFPTKLYTHFPKNFLQIIQTIFRRLFRVYAHIYHHHFCHVVTLDMQRHVNTCFKHFLYFSDKFDLIDEEELAPLNELIQKFRERKNSNSN